jgi:hypothetical protein
MNGVLRTSLLPYSGLMKNSQYSQFWVDWAVSVLLRNLSFGVGSRASGWS